MVSRAVLYLLFGWVLVCLFDLIWSVSNHAQFIKSFRTADERGMWPTETPKEGEKKVASSPLAVDFIQFLYVARAWQIGSISDIYDFDEQRRHLDAITEKPDDEKWSFEPRTLSFGYPPFYLWLPRVLVGLPYKTALLVWIGLQACFAALAVRLWWCELRDQQRLFWLVFVTFLIYPPTTINENLGHTAFLGMLGLSGMFFHLNRGRDFWAGLCLSLLFYKPPMGLVVGPVLLLCGRGRAVAGVAVGGALLAGLGAIIDPSLFEAWFKMVSEVSKIAWSHPGWYDKQFGWLGMVATFSGRSPTDFTWQDRVWWLAPIAGVLVSLMWACWQRWQPGSPRLSAMFAAMVLATSFVSPYQFFYDVVLLMIAAVYSLRTLRYRPIWHAWLVLVGLGLTSLGVAGGFTVVDELRTWTGKLSEWLGWGETLKFGLQLAPLGTLCWFVAEVWAARTLPKSDFGEKFAEKELLIAGK